MLIRRKLWLSYLVNIETTSSQGGILTGDRGSQARGPRNPPYPACLQLYTLGSPVQPISSLDHPKQRKASIFSNSNSNCNSFLYSVEPHLLLRALLFSGVLRKIS